MEQMGKYIYSIIETSEKKGFGPCGMGEPKGELSTVNYKDIAAVVSDSPIIQYRVTRDNSMAHQHAIEAVMKEHTVLPVAFSTIAESEEEVLDVLKERYDEFKDLLSEMSGKTEIGIKAMWTNMDNVFNDILQQNQDIKALKDRLEGEDSNKTYYDRIELGKMVEDALKNKREMSERRILNRLKEKACDFKVHKTYWDKLITSCAFLVEKEHEQEFEDAVNQLQTEYGEKAQFKYVNSAPPFNFVTVLIHLKSASEIQGDLGKGDFTRPSKGEAEASPTQEQAGRGDLGRGDFSRPSRPNKEEK